MKRRHAIRTLLQSGEATGAVKAELERLLRNNKEVLPGWTPGYLKKLGRIDTVIDVGVLNGTPELYEAFPDAELILVEALALYEGACQKILETRRGEYHICALGASDGTTTIRHYPDRPAVSSLLQAIAQPGTGRDNVEEIVTPMRRLDTLLENRSLHGNVLLKVDVEGLEHLVMLGAQKTLRSVKYCITETSIRHRHEGSYRFSQFISLMAANGFELFDCLRVTRDTAFAPRASIMDAIFLNTAME